MVESLDVFAVNNGQAKWLNSAATFAEAIKTLTRTGPGSYFVYSQSEQKRSFYSVSSEGTVEEMCEQ